MLTRKQPESGVTGERRVGGDDRGLTRVQNGLTGGEGSFTQGVHCEYIGGSETIGPDITQQAHGRHFFKIPTNLPSKNPPGKV